MENEETAESLNYDFNYNMVLGKTLISKLALPQERQLATDWLQKLSTCGSAFEELQLRNMFAYLLLQSLQEGLLRHPFDAEPPPAPLTSLMHLLPEEAFGQGGDNYDGQEHEGAGGFAHSGASGPRPPPYDYSPDGGEFFAAQPIPRCGAFCYLAVVARQDQ